MMENIIEKVARAIALAPYEHKARVAIEAMRDYLGIDPLHEPPKGAFDEVPPGWAKDGHNGDMAERCGRCHAWCSVVRPGKTQCDNCWEGENMAALFHSALRGLDFP